MKRFTYIYALADPDSGEIRYVGKADNLKRRLRLHLWRAKQEGPKPHSSCWVRGIVDRGKKPDMLMLEKVASDRWQEAEKRHIAELRDKGHDLTNLTDGGDGRLGSGGYKQSPESNAKRSAATKEWWADKHRRAVRRQQLKAAWGSGELRDRHSVSCKRSWTDERRSQASKTGKEASKKLWSDQEFRKKHAEGVSKSLKRMWKNKDYREAYTKAAKLRWKDPKYREKMFSMMEENRYRNSEIQKELWKDPEYRERQSRSRRRGQLNRGIAQREKQCQDMPIGEVKALMSSGMGRVSVASHFGITTGAFKKRLRRLYDTTWTRLKKEYGDGVF